MINASILGVTGFTGEEILKLLFKHPDVKIKRLMTRKEDLVDIETLMPYLPKDHELSIEETQMDKLIEESDVVFLALPHTVSMRFTKPIIDAGKVVIDLSADFRIKDKTIYEKWYNTVHVEESLLESSAYGLPEVYRDKIKQARLIANPGCYPTSVLLPLYPLLRNKLIDAKQIIVDSKTGLSGAGRGLSPMKMFWEVHDNFKAYKINAHQHQPEMEQIATEMHHSPVFINFVPHLLPMDRGILSTIYIKKANGKTNDELYDALQEAYINSPFVKIYPYGSTPTLKDVQRTNLCAIGINKEDGMETAVIICCIDNLLKGAAGQAVQNMNVRFDLPETQSLL